jgi:hypothetical protein
MSDDNSRSAIASRLGFGNKRGPQLPPITDDEVLEAAISKALTDTHKLKQESSQWREKAMSLQAELSSEKQSLHHEIATQKQELTEEISTQKHEFEGKLSIARSENDSLRRQISEVGAKMEYYQRWALELVTKVNDLEIFYNGELQKLHEAADLCQRGMLSAVGATSRTMKQFLDDLHAKANAGEYRQPGSQEKQPGPPKEKNLVKPDRLAELTEEEQQALEHVVAKLPHVGRPDTMK